MSLNGQSSALDFVLTALDRHPRSTAGLDASRHSSPHVPHHCWVDGEPRNPVTNHGYFTCPASHMDSVLDARPADMYWPVSYWAMYND